MAKKKARPEFKPPSTKAAATAGSDWVYKTDEPTSAKAVEVVTTEVVVAEVTDQEEKAKRIVSEYSSYCAGAGLIPAPALDVLVIGALQLKMISALAKNYGVPFDDAIGRSLIASTLGGTLSIGVGYRVGKSLFKAIPGVGSLIAMVIMPTSAYTATRVIGDMFVRHFAKGGTLQSFEPAKAAATA